MFLSINTRRIVMGCRTLHQRIPLVWLVAASLLLTTGSRAETEVQALFRTGYSELKAGNHLEAVSRFKRGLQIAPDDAIGHFYLGMSYRGLGQSDLASQEFILSLNIDRSSSVANQALRQYLSGKTFSVSVNYSDALTGGKLDNIVYCKYDFTRTLSLSFGQISESGRLAWKKVQSRGRFDSDAAFRTLWTQRDQSDLEYLASQRDIVHQSRAEAKQRQFDKVSGKLDALREECRSAYIVNLVYSILLPMTATSDETIFVVLESDSDDSPIGTKGKGKIEIIDNGSSLRLEFDDLIFVMKNNH